MLILIVVGVVVFLFFSVLFRFYPKNAPEPYWAKMVVALIFASFTLVLSAGVVLLAEWFREVLR